MKDFIFKDYASWKIENHEVFETFKSNMNPIYERLEPVYVVLEYIYEMACNNQELDEDYQTIFEVGFNYLHDQFNVIKIYFESLFQKNCDDFVEFSEMLLFLLYIFDVRNDVESHGAEVDFEALDNAETYIENMIMERNKDYAFVRNLMNEALGEIDKQIDYEFVSIVDIYHEIAETLGIFLYEEDDYIIGREV